MHRNNSNYEKIWSYNLDWSPCGTGIFRCLRHTQRLDKVGEGTARIQEILKRREGASVYGSPEIIQAFGAETQRLRHQLDSINNILGENEPK